MPKSHSLTIIVPCLNEEENVTQAISDLLAAFADFGHSWEILVVDDCSTDRTNEIVQKMLAKNPLIRLVRNEKNLGLGGAYRVGVMNSNMTHSVLFPGDNEVNAGTIRRMCDHIGEADILISYAENPEVRPLKRRIISKVFTFLTNVICMRWLKYYNGPVVQSRALLSTITLKANNFAYQADIMAQLLRLGHTYKQYPFRLNYQSVRIRALTLGNFVMVGKTLFNIALISWSPFPPKGEHIPQNSDSAKNRVTS